MAVFCGYHNSFSSSVKWKNLLISSATFSFSSKSVLRIVNNCMIYESTIAGIYNMLGGLMRPSGCSSLIAAGILSNADGGTIYFRAVLTVPLAVL